MPFENYWHCRSLAFSLVPRCHSIEARRSAPARRCGELVEAGHLNALIRASERRTLRGSLAKKGALRATGIGRRHNTRGRKNCPMEQMSTSTKATPESLVSMSTTPSRPILPATKGFDCCRICGNEAVMTAEHVPPRAAFNKGTGRNVGLNEILGPKALNSMDLGSGPSQQGGIKGYTLCSTCNSRTGKLWGPEYKEWANWFAALILQTEELYGASAPAAHSPAEARRTPPGPLAKAATKWASKPSWPAGSPNGSTPGWIEMNSSAMTHTWQWPAQ